jgi:hypothetical protein
LRFSERRVEKVEAAAD